MIFDTIKVALDFLYQHWKCHFLAPQYGQTESARVETSKKAVRVLAQKKSKTTFIIQTFPKNEVLGLRFYFLSFFDASFYSFHFRALLSTLLEGKSDKNEKYDFAK